MCAFAGFIFQDFRTAPRRDMMTLWATPTCLDSVCVYVRNQTMESMETTIVTSFSILKASNFQQTWPNFHEVKTPEDGLVAHCQHTWKAWKHPSSSNFLMKFTQIHSSQNLKNPPKMDLDIDHPNLPSSTRCASPALHREDPLQSHPFESNLLFLRLNPFLLPLERQLPNSWKLFAEAPGHQATSSLPMKRFNGFYLWSLCLSSYQWICQDGGHNLADDSSEK